MPDGANTPNQATAVADATSLPESGVEENDRLDHSVRLAGIMAEIRALTGGILSPGSRASVLKPPLSRQDAVQYIDSIVGNLTSESRELQPDVLRQRMHDRFFELLRQRGPSKKNIDEPKRAVKIGLSMLEAVYENIKEIDLRKMATSIAKKIPLLEGPATRFPLGIDEKSLRNYYYDETNNQLTPAGVQLLERLRRNNSNPAKVILAFSAALDPKHFRSVANIPADLYPKKTGSAGLQLDLNAILESSDSGVDPETYTRLQRLAEAYEAYNAIPENQRYYEPPIAPTGRQSSDDKYRAQDENFKRTKSMVQVIHEAAKSVQDHATSLGANAPAIISEFTAANIQKLDPARALAPDPANPTVPIAGLPQPLQIRQMLTQFTKNNFKSAADYARDAKQTNGSGLDGANATDKLLSAYIGRVGDVSARNSLLALASLNGRVSAAQEEDRALRTDLANVSPDVAARKEWKKLNSEVNKDAQRSFFDREPQREFLDRINSTKFLGLKNKERLLDPESVPLKNLLTRYYGLNYLTKLPATDEKHIPLLPSVATELQELRAAILKRAEENMFVLLQKKKINTLGADDAKELGIPHLNIEGVDRTLFLQRLGQDLDRSDIPSEYYEDATKAINNAWAPFAQRKENKKKKAEDWEKWKQENAFVNAAAVTGDYYWKNKYWAAAGAVAGSLAFTPIVGLGLGVVIAPPLKSVTKWGFSKLFNGFKNVYNHLTTVNGTTFGK